MKGTRPENVPVEGADYNLIINLQAASALGIEVPDETLKQADLIVR
ncbi:MAG TPA: hypothetical protein ENH04_06445 [Nitrospirae bacterium]|nr:hypothetical protein [Nitrospirota bacterium]